MKTRYAILSVIAGLILIALIGQSERQLIALVAGLFIVLGVLGLVVHLVKGQRPAPKPDFTPEQLNAMQGLVAEKLQDIEQQRRDVIKKAAREGKTISTETVLRHLDASKASHQGLNHEQYIAAADKLAQEFRTKYGDQIPVDEAYRIMKEWE